MSFKEALQTADRHIAAHLGQAGIQYRTGLGVVVDLWDAATGEPKAVFERPYEEVIIETAPLSSSRPRCLIRLEDLPFDPAEDEGFILYDGETFKVVDVQKDGEGSALLILQVT